MIQFHIFKVNFCLDNAFRFIWSQIFTRTLMVFALYEHLQKFARTYHVFLRDRVPSILTTYFKKKIRRHSASIFQFYGTAFFLKKTNEKKSPHFVVLSCCGLLLRMPSARRLLDRARRCGWPSSTSTTTTSSTAPRQRSPSVS